MDMKAKILVLGVKGYSFEQDGKLVSGAKVTYVAQESNEDNCIGYLPLQENVDLSFAQNVKTNIPGIFEATYQMVPGKNNKPTLTIKSLSPVKNVDMGKVING